MQTLVSLYLQAWAVELAKLREQRAAMPWNLRGVSPETPVLLSRIVAQRELVAARCPHARAAGVRAGMTLAEARALLPCGAEPMVCEHSPRRDAAALRKLATWAVRFTPLVSVDPPDGLLLDVTNSLRLFGGVEQVLVKLVRGVKKLGFTCRATAAPTFGAAWAVARFASFDARSQGALQELEPVLSESAESQPDLFAAVAPRAKLVTVHRRAAVLRAAAEHDVATVLVTLPIAALRVEQATVDALEEVGVLTIGHLIALPRRALPSRFGALLALRLQQALGYQRERIEPARVVEPVRAETVFDGPTTDSAAIHACVRRLLDRCLAELSRRVLGVRRVEIILTRSDLDPVVLDVTLSQPSESASHIWALLRPKIEAANLGFGIEAIEMRMPWLSRVRDAQAALPAMRQVGTDAVPDDRSADRATGELVDTLTARLGAGRVVRVMPSQSHLPEQVFGMCGAIEHAASEIARALSAHGEGRIVTGSPRPTRLIDPPRAVQVVALSPDGPVVRIRIDGEDTGILTSIGPERIGEEWWRSTSGGAGDALHARDYFRLQDQTGRWLWVFRHDPTGRWWLHGAWD